MIKKKICLIGEFAVGKTSLIQQYVKGIFSEDYLTTVGVKIDQRQETIAEKKVLLMIWDLAGRDQFANVQKSYLRGADGFLFVACLLYTSPSPRDQRGSRMPSSA